MAQESKPQGWEAARRVSQSANVSNVLVSFLVIPVFGAQEGRVSIVQCYLELSRATSAGPRGALRLLQLAGLAEGADPLHVLGDAPILTKMTGAA